jgi:hypothetical protein
MQDAKRWCGGSRKEFLIGRVTDLSVLVEKKHMVLDT